MLKNLEFSVTFASTKRTITGNHTFEKGVTAISGPNEQGKSIRLEMIRYALFGQKALRASRDQYDKLKAELSFQVGERSYVVSRSLSRVRLSEDGKEVVSGTKPVNEKIISVLGYDLSVFDVSNNCTQGEVSALSDMKPTERKAMVDQVVGLNTLDDLVDYVAGEAKTTRAQLNVLRPALGEEPTEPEIPEGYDDPDVLQKKIDDTRTLLFTRNNLRVKANQNLPPLGARPVEPDIPYSKEELKALSDENTAKTKQRVAALQELSGLPEAEFSLSQISAFRLQEAEFRNWEKAQEMVGRILQYRPVFTRDQLAQAETVWDQIACFDADAKLRDKIQSLTSVGLIYCEECGHGQHPEAIRNQITALEAQINGSVPKRPAEPSIARKDITGERIRIDQWDSLQPELEEAQAVQEPPRPKFTGSELDRMERTAQHKERRDELVALVSSIPADLPDYREKIGTITAYEHEKQIYDLQLGEFTRVFQEKESAQEELDALADADEGELERLGHTLRESITYDSDLRAYLRRKEEWQKASDQIRDLEEQDRGYVAASKALKELRTEVKKYLVPSLNRMSSYLLNQMTDGQRQVVLIDEEFNITIDGQPIETLSGSGVAVANLAIRLGLGRVLTHQVFSVFMGDEIDASMDDNRATHTINCLLKLKENVDQIILVSHKDHEVDHLITL